MASRTILESVCKNPPVVERVGRFFVLRDDMFEGGTKARLLEVMLHMIPQREIVYAGHAYGAAAYALASACAKHDKRATIFLPKMEVYPDPVKPLFNHAAARVIKSQATLQSDIQKEAEIYVVQSQDRHIFPIGFWNEQFQYLITQYAWALPINPREVWTLIGSGNLGTALSQAWPQAEIMGVSMGFPHVKASGLSRLFEIAGTPEDPAANPPPFPSSAYYDAKVWKFIKKHGRDDALFWNVT